MGLHGRSFLRKRRREKVNGRVVLSVSNSLPLGGGAVSLRLISSGSGDPSRDMQGKMGKKAYLSRIAGEEDVFSVCFDWDEEIGIPGAFFLRSHHLTNFFLKFLTLEDVPGHGRIHFDCNSWIYPSISSYRIFFANKAYLPYTTPNPLRKYREDELKSLRGDGTGVRQKKDRIYDYDIYNDIYDLNDPNYSSTYVCPILGSLEYPYPRRGRTGRPCSEKGNNKYESRLSSLIPSNIYVPRDERFCHTKQSEFRAYKYKSVVKSFIQTTIGVIFKNRREFNSFQEVLGIYQRGASLSANFLESLRPYIQGHPFLKEFFATEQGFRKFQMPQVIEDNDSGWKADGEFARQMLAGVNPITIRRLQEFPPLSKLDPREYGDQNSTITEEHVMNSLDGFTVDEAIRHNKLYILDHHDSVIPFLRRINTTRTKTYATRTLLFLKDDGTLKPLAIELSLPHPEGDEFGAISRVLLPTGTGVDASIWKMAKGYVLVNDSGHHELISHWLNTHAVIEPFVIATNRQLSVIHPIHKLLVPHFKDTMAINALARESLICTNGVVQKTQYPSIYSMEISSFGYKNWVFPDQALPADLIKRGVAIKDSSSPHCLQLLIEEYPYAADGLEIWSAVKTWVVDYCTFYYKDDVAVRSDFELQLWWKELREKGHEDKKDEPWWPKMQTVKELINSCTIIIWISSALHAAINFGQFAYGGFFPNRPSISTRLLPMEGTPAYEELESNPEKAFLKTFTSEPKDDFLGVAIIGVLSKHFSDEVYLGQRNHSEWTSDMEPLEAFEKFRRRLTEIEDLIERRNKDPKLKNRTGPVNIPYTLLFPTSTEGVTGRGIPNSISI